MQLSFDAEHALRQLPARRLCNIQEQIAMVGHKESRLSLRLFQKPYCGAADAECTYRLGGCGSEAGRYRRRSGSREGRTGGRTRRTSASKWLVGTRPAMQQL